MRTTAALTEIRKRANARHQKAVRIPVTFAPVAFARVVTPRSPTAPTPSSTKPITKADAWTAIQRLAEPMRLAKGVTVEVAIDRLVQEHPELKALYDRATSAQAPIKAREKSGITPAQLVNSPTGQRWMPLILEKKRQTVMKARPGSFGQRLVEEVESLAVELQTERPDLGSQEAFTAVILMGMSSFESKNAAKLMWRFIDGPESDLDLEVALARPDIQEALDGVGLKF